MNIPLIVHSRNAEKEIYDILMNEKKNNKNLKVLMHCFTGSKDFSRKLLDIGCYISVSGIITFKNSSDLTNTVSAIPIEKLLIKCTYIARARSARAGEHQDIKKHLEKLLNKIENVLPSC